MSKKYKQLTIGERGGLGDAISDDDDSIEEENGKPYEFYMRSSKRFQKNTVDDRVYGVKFRENMIGQRLVDVQ